MSQYGPEIWIAKDVVELAQEAAKRVIEVARKMIATKGHFSIVLSGGRTPKMFYQVLATHRELDWSKGVFFFGDERMVPLEHVDSNYYLAKETLFSPLGIQDSQVHSVSTLSQPQIAASMYSEVIRAYLDKNQGSFDVVLLGLGPDGHTASIFPGDPILFDPKSTILCKEVLSAPKPPPLRITMTPFALNQARQVIVLVDGKEKAAAVCAALESDTDPVEIPIRSIMSHKMTWLIDRLAAAGLTQTG